MTVSRASVRSVFASGALALLLAPQAGCSLDLCIDQAQLAQEAIGSDQSAIIGGDVDDVNRATVAILFDKADGGHALCSGTLISATAGHGYVLTAAHCVAGTVTHVYQAVDWRDCTPSGDASKCEGSFTPISWRAHPDYSTSDYQYDFAIIEVEGVPEGAPVIPIASHDEVQEGGTVELSGFGQTVVGESGSAPPQSLRHHVDATVATVLPTKIRIDASTGRTACFGDSGGPALATVSGGRRVIGVASTSDPTCEHVASYGRVAAVAVDFIAPSLKEPSPPQGGAGSGGGGNTGGAAPQGGAPGSGGAASAGGAPSAGGSEVGAGDAGGDGSGAAGSAGDGCIPLTLQCSATPGAGDEGPWALGALSALLVSARRRRR